MQLAISHPLVSFSLGQACSHIAALLFFLEKHAGDDKLPTELSKTSKPMTWNQPPKKEVLPARAQDVIFVKPVHSDVKPTAENTVCISRSDFDPRHPTHRTLNTEAVKSLLSQIQSSVPLTGLSQFRERNPQVVDPNSNSSGALRLWSHVIFSHENTAAVSSDMFYKPTAAQCFEYQQGRTLSQSEVEAIEAATRGQTESTLWYALHNGRLTSSRFGEILHRRSTTNPRRVVRDIMGYGGHSRGMPPQMRWGKDNESTARKLYLENRKSCGEEMIFEPSGLHLLPEKSYLGTSSDGKLTCKSADTCCNGCLEIKCPYSIGGMITISMKPLDIANQFGSKFFMHQGEDGLLHLPREHPYFAQVQGEMAIIGVEWCDFVVCSGGDIVVERILADFQYWTELSDILDTFCVQYVVPEILSGTIFTEEYSSLLGHDI